MKLTLTKRPIILSTQKTGPSAVVAMLEAPPPTAQPSKEPARVALLFGDDEHEGRIELTIDEAAGLAQGMITCACVAAAGPPPRILSADRARLSLVAENKKQ